MTARSGPQQRPPRTGLDLAGFPGIVLRRDDWRYRAHTKNHGGAAGAWHFSSGPGGRFNLAEPYGTCYAADTPHTALAELLGPELQDMGGVGAALAATLIVTPIAVPNDIRAADLNDSAAGRYGVVNELSAGAYPDYGIPRAWADAFHKTGFGGIRYLPRLVAGSSHNAWALFGRADTAPDLPHGNAEEATLVLQQVGIPLYGDVTAAQVTVIDPPDWPAATR